MAFRIKKSTTGFSSIIVKAYSNTSSGTISGAIKICEFSLGVNDRYGQIQRLWFIKDVASDTEVFFVNLTNFSDMTSSAQSPSSLAIDWTVTQYFMITITLFNTNDGALVSGYHLIQI